jgi:hypothetical protein
MAQKGFHIGGFETNHPIKPHKQAELNEKEKQRQAAKRQELVKKLKANAASAKTERAGTSPMAGVAGSLFDPMHTMDD